MVTNLKQHYTAKHAHILFKTGVSKQNWRVGLMVELSLSSAPVLEEKDGYRAGPSGGVNARSHTGFYTLATTTNGRRAQRLLNKFWDLQLPFINPSTRLQQRSSDLYCWVFMLSNADCWLELEWKHPLLDDPSLKERFVSRHFNAESPPLYYAFKARISVSIHFEK